MILSLCSVQVQAQFVVQDVRIGDTTASYLDFEFWQAGHRFCFQDEDNAGYVGLLDSLTGDLITASGKDFLFDNALAPITQSINGPEWGYREGGADVFFTKQTGSNRSIGKATWDGTGYAVTDLSASLPGKRFATVCSKNPTDTVASLVYAQGNNILNFTVHHSQAVNPVTDDPVPYGANSSSGPRFIDGETALLTNEVVGGFTQIFRYDLVTAGLTQLTFDPGDKIDAFLFTAPDFGGSRLLLCTVNDSMLRLYQEIAGAFVYQYDIQLPGDYQYYFSAEPFVFQNKSYLFVCAAHQKFIPGSQNNSLPADVWLVGLQQNNPWFRKISDNRMALRLDPEVFITPTEAYIYYYEYRQNGNVHPVALHKCSSGLGNNPFTPVSEAGVEANRHVYPNPFATQLNLRNATGTETFVLTTTLGQVVFAGKDMAGQDFSTLPPGWYFLKINAGSSRRAEVIKLVKN